MQKTLIVVGSAIVIIAGILLIRQTAHAPIGVENLNKNPVVSSQPQAQLKNTDQNIVVISPSVNSVVGNPITVSGNARVFEGAFQYALRDTSGKVWFQSTGQAGTPDDNFFRKFSVKIPVMNGAPKDLIIEVFEYSAQDGSIINLVRVPVRLATQETTTVQAYLHNRRLNANDVCDVVFPVPRTIIKTNEPAYMSLYELLRGPIGTDKDNQYYTSIPEGVKINSLRITNGIAHADFDATLEYQVGGSCRVQAIRTQITNTLKQFSTVKNVIISINGRTEDILQP